METAEPNANWVITRGQPRSNNGLQQLSPWQNAASEDMHLLAELDFNVYHRRTTHHKKVAQN